jgi:GNAT superfamily N-acetyltransferase
MVMPVSIRLDENVRAALDEEARARGVGLSTYLRQVATETAHRLRRERIRRQSKAVGEHAARSPEAAEFYEAWGTPRTEGQ